MHKTKKITLWLVIFLCLGTGFNACTNQINPAAWVYTEGNIQDIEPMDDGTFSYALVYDAKESTAINIVGKPIKGPIRQHYLGKRKQPLPDQRIRLRYLREEPVLYELLDAIRYQSE